MNIYIEENLGAGVYCIKNLRTGKMYIGQSFNITNRLSTHFQQLKLRKHRIKDLQDDYNCGDRFSYEILSRAKAASKDYLRKLLITMEQEHIAKTSSSMLYNTDLSAPYIWNTVIQIPESIREDDRYHAGDIYRPEFQPFIMRDQV